MCRTGLVVIIAKHIAIFTWAVAALSCRAPNDAPKAEKIKDKALAQTASTPKLQTCEDVTNIDLALGGEAPPIILIGEIHGYTGAPALVEALLCHARKAGFKTYLAMELPKEREALAHKFIRSNGDKAAYRAILSDSRWTSSGDGRRTAASFRLLEYLRQQTGDNKIGLTYFAPDSDRLKTMLQEDGAPAAYEAALAEQLRAGFIQSQADKMIVLTGNWHARQDYSTFAGERYLTMAGYFGADEAVSFNIHSDVVADMSLELSDKDAAYDGVYSASHNEKADMMPSPFR